MNTPVQPEAIAAMDKAVDRLASTEAHALAAFGVLDATVHQLVASIQTADSPARTAGFVTDTLQALTLAGQQLETYQDAADDVVVTFGAAVGEFEGQAPRALDTLLVRLSHAIEGIQPPWQRMSSPSVAEMTLYSANGAPLFSTTSANV